MTARNLSQEMAERVITLDTMQSTERTGGGLLQPAAWSQFTCIEDSNLAEYRRQVVLVLLTQLPAADQWIKLPACQGMSYVAQNYFK